MSRIDLHIHTTASDGTDSPRLIVQQAAQLSLRAVAVTDHDTVAGIAEAQAAGRELGVEVLPGIEISTDYRGTDAHILGYFIDPTSSALRQLTEWMVAERDSRNSAMAANMAADGIDISPEQLRRAHPDAVIGRPHMAQRLMELGLVGSVKEAFALYLGSGKKYYLPRRRIPLPEAVEIIRAAGGIASAAHPLQYGFSESGTADYLRFARGAGCAALEAYYSEHSPAQRDALLAAAEELGMAVSGGSDYHGSVKPHIALGSGINGSLNVPYSVLEGLKERRS